MAIEIISLSGSAKIVEGDTLTKLQFQLQDENETPVMLVTKDNSSDPIGIYANVISSKDMVALQREVTLISPAEGIFSINPQDIKDAMYAEVVINFTKDKTAIYPLPITEVTVDRGLPKSDEDYLWVG